MKAKPAYINEEQPVEQSEKGLKELATLIDEVSTFQSDEAALDKRIKEIGRKIIEREGLALELMEDAGVSEFSTELGNSAKKREFINAKIADNALFLKDLQERGEEGLVQIGVSGALYKDFEDFFKQKHNRTFDANEVQLKVHPQSLKSYVKERGEDNAPAGLNINRYLTVKIKRKK
jgi:hypothetical protein